jgi:hypothetical protein
LVSLLGEASHEYVNRDALNCGVPVGVDVARIFLRSGVVRASRDQILRLNLKEDPLPEEYLFVVNSSGIDTIDEILQARTSLYQRVYFHAVTRTTERLLSLSLEANVADPKPDDHIVNALKLWAQKDSNRSVKRLASALIDIGYANAGALLVTSVSTPTGTITPLWQPGLYQGQPWMPLAIRTNKLRYLVIG